MPDCYKIKLATLGYWLVYRVIDSTLTVVVVAAGRRERSVVYTTALPRV